MVVPRIPYTTPFPPPSAYPPSAVALPHAITATTHFLSSHQRTLLLTGAGISVASGLADYRGEKGTYRLNRAYRPIFYSEFASKHESRKRYWARSYLGWPTMLRSRPNGAHWAVARLWSMGMLSGIVTQNVDSLHSRVTPEPLVTELHGTLRTLTCLTCGSTHSRDDFQKTLAALNPTWSDFLSTAEEAGVFSSNPSRAEKGIKTNPDGDVDLPSAPYTLFRYPPCPSCLTKRPGDVRVDDDGAHIPNATSSEEKTVGILKPSVTFFGEAVSRAAKDAAEQGMQEADAILVVGSSLATYSAWRIVRAAAQAGKGVGVINIGGVRGEDEFFAHGGSGRLRVDLAAKDVLAGAVTEMGGTVDGAEHQSWGAEGGLGG